MYKGHKDISFVTDEMIYRVKFTEHTNTVYSAGFWDSMGVAVPDYPYDAPWVHQVFESDCDYWVHEVKHQFDDVLKYSVATVNCIKPGRFIAPHTDTLYKIKERVKKEKLNIKGLEPVRINLFLQDRLMGHYFEMENESWIDYKKGDFTVIKPNAEHLVANLGYQNRYTLQVTGFAEKGTF
jgi:hypothetical protein